MTTPVERAPAGADDLDRAARRNSSLVAAGILASRLIGFVRLRVFAHFLGSSAVADAFTTAFRIPNVLQNLLGEGVLSASFIPVHARLLDEGRHEEAGRVAGAVLGLLIAIAGGVTLLAVVLADPIASLLAPGFEGQKHELTARLIRIVTPGIGLLVVSAWCLGILNAHRRFFLSYVAPVLWNVAQIVALVGAGWLILDSPLDVRGITAVDQSRLAVALALGTVAGGMLQVLVQLPVVLRLEPHLRPSIDRTLPGVRRVLRQAGPVVAGRGVVQLATWVDVLLASLLATGAVSLLGYAQPLYLLPISVFGMSVAAAELPDLATIDSTDVERLSRRVDAGLGRIAFWVVGTVVLYLTVGDLLIGLLFQSGAFDRSTTTAVWLVLAMFALGLVASTSSRLLQSVFYGIGDTRTPAITSVVRVGVSIVVGAFLMVQFDRFEVVGRGVRVVAGTTFPVWRPVDAALRGDGVDVVRLGAVGLALAAGVGAWVEWRRLRRGVGEAVGLAARLGGSARLRLVVPGLLATAVGLALRQVVGGLPVAAAGLLAVAVVGITYVAAGLWTGVAEVHGLIASLGPRLGRPGAILLLWRAQVRRRRSHRDGTGDA